jgi:hypothetical protein
MLTISRAAMLLAAAALSACTAPTGPVEVTRFHDQSALDRLGQASVDVTPAPGQPDTLALAPYQSAVAAELAELGYRPGTGRTDLVAEVAVERFRIGPQGGRSPVSVGVGGSTGTFGTGVGLGVGINLGGGGGERIGTDLRVVLRDRGSGQSVWEGRASFAVAPNSPLADPAANARAVASALFREFPGNNGETVEVSVD